jgi:N-acetyl-anhydromuramyl-L-alanine amidase AmpD
VLWRGVLLTPLEANQTLIGIEFENIEDGHQALTNVQYIVGAALVARLQGVHGLDVRSFDTHGHVARPAGRKTDPKTFSWSVFVNEMYNPSIEASELVFPAVLP